MRFVNETASEAELVRVSRDRQSTAAAVVVKSTYEIERGRCTLSRRQRRILSNPQTIAGLAFEPEVVLAKVGIDVLVAGAARSTSGSTRMMAVGVSVEDWTRQLLVFGEREWKPKMFGWTPSDPIPFEELPVTWPNAFGGVARCNDNPVPHPGNPRGKGYLVDIDDRTEGTLLPNIEDPDDLLTRPGQLVEPAGFGPLPATSALRVEPALDPVKFHGVSTSIWNVAPPRNRLGPLRGGESCRLWGWAGLPSEEFELPTESMVVEVGIDGRDYEFWPRVDTICVLPATRELVVTRRATFTYRYARNAPRVARLRHAGRSSAPTLRGIHG